MNPLSFWGEEKERPGHVVLRSFVYIFAYSTHFVMFLCFSGVYVHWAWDRFYFLLVRIFEDC